GCRPFSELSSRWFPEESTCDVSVTGATCCPHFAQEPVSTALPLRSSSVNLMISTEPRQFWQNTILSNDFMFLVHNELEDLKSQIVTSRIGVHPARLRRSMARQWNDLRIDPTCARCAGGTPYSCGMAGARVARAGVETARPSGCHAGTPLPQETGTPEPGVTGGRQYHGCPGTGGECIFRPHDERQAMKLKVDREAGALYLRLDDSPIVESEEVSPGVVLDFNQQNQVVGVEMLNLSQRAQGLNIKEFQ